MPGVRRGTLPPGRPAVRHDLTAVYVLALTAAGYLPVDLMKGGEAHVLVDSCCPGLACFRRLNNFCYGGRVPRKICPF